MEKQIQKFADKEPCFLHSIPKESFILYHSEEFGLALAIFFGPCKFDPIKKELLIISAAIAIEDWEAKKVEIKHVSSYTATPNKELPDAYLLDKEEVIDFPWNLRFKEQLFFGIE